MDFYVIGISINLTVMTVLVITLKKMTLKFSSLKKKQRLFLTVSVGQESGHGIAGSSGCLTRL